MKIDLVIPYVNVNDQVWRKTFMDFCKKHNNTNVATMGGKRYEDDGLITYQLKLAHKNMSFIRDIYLLVSNIEQVPAGIDESIKIVLHKDFIPREYLPTFNSTTIEMFLWNIKELGEYFIYANDDMLPCKALSETDFYKNGSIKMNFILNNIRECKSEFRFQCKNSYQHICNALNLKYPQDMYIRPEHTMTPMIKSHCKEVFDLLENVIKRHIWAFRTMYQHNQYIYPNYEKLKYRAYESNIDFLYTELTNGIDLKHQIVCINKYDMKLKPQLIEELEKLL